MQGVQPGAVDLSLALLARWSVVAEEEGDRTKESVS